MSKAYYTPEPGKPQTAKAGRFRPVKMEVAAIRQRVSKDLYASPASGIRELLANEIRAAVKAKEGGADPSIEVTVRSDMVRVWGMDSLGMERKIFEEIYMTLGRSSNFDGKTSGQFGLGRAAYTTISDHMLLETSHRNGDNYSVLGVEGRGYQTGLPEPDIPHGTRVTLVPREKGAEHVDGMESMVFWTAKRSPIPITLVARGRTEYLEREPLQRVELDMHADLPEVEFATSVWRRKGNDVTAWLCGIPIKFEYRGAYPLFGLSLDIHDERKFPPTPDRERMAEKAEREISGIIDREITRRLGDFPMDDVVAALAHPYRAFAYHARRGHPDGFGRQVCRYGKPDEHLALVAGNPVLNCKARFEKARIDAVLEAFPDAEFVTNAPELPYINDFMKQHGIRARVRPRPVSDGKVVIHVRSSTLRIDPQNPPKEYTIYKVDNGETIRTYRGTARAYDVAMTVHDVEGALDLKEEIERAKRYEFTTTRGKMTGRQLLEYNMHASIVPTTRQSLVDCWEGGLFPDKDIVVVLAGPGIPYEELLWQNHNTALRKRFRLGFWGGEHAVETYMRLANPVLKGLLRDGGQNVQTPYYCDELMKLDGQEPLPHDGECCCGCRA